MEEKVAAVKNVLLETAERCREVKRDLAHGTANYLAHAKPLMSKRRLARERRDKEEIASLSKCIQKEVRRAMKSKIREAIDKI